jgi:hypothetical protein
MDLDKLLASLTAAAGAPAADAPLISVATYVPPTSKKPAADRDAARRMLAAFGQWLVTYDRIAPGAPAERRAALTSLTSRPGETENVIEELGDSLLRSDVDPAWMGFASAYLAPGPGHLGDDYFKLFVEAPGGRSLRDAHPTLADYAQLATSIESRARRFRQPAADWDRPLDPAGAPQPSLWQGGTADEWLQRLSTYHDLLDSPPKVLRARLAEYWSLVDAAPALATPDVASALARTYLWVDDAGIQQAVYRALSQLPPLFALRGILAHIAELESKTDWAITVVDVFRDDLDEAVLAEMARLIEAAPLASQAAYERTLQRAEQSGSEHATRLLRELAK